MSIALTIILIIFYVSLAYELFVLKVPSIVTSKKIIEANTSYKLNFSADKQHIFEWSNFLKFVIFYFPLIFVFGLDFIPIFSYFEIIGYQNQFIFVCIGIILILMGRFVSYLFINEIKKRKINEELITTGVFKYSRNPCQTGLYISYLGFLLIYPSILFMICFVITLIYMNFKIELEEDYLNQKFKKNYQYYKQKTRRYL